VIEEILKRSLSKSQQNSTKEISQILKRKLPETQSISHYDGLWNESDFALGQISILKGRDNTKLLSSLCTDRLKEAYFIEKAGMSFSAKMSLLSQSIDEQILYSMFCAEEATHFHCIESLLTGVSLEGDNSFVTLLNEIIISGERRPLVFIIQVVLEGWGIDHYSLMSQSCLNPEVKKILQNILQDEAAHHGSGLSLFDEQALTDTEFKYIIEMMSQFMQMVTVGPVGLLGQVESSLGHLTSGQRNTVHQEVNSYGETSRKVELIKSMMNKAKAFKIIEKLESHKCFDINLR
jgi:rubrerythrin